MQTAQPASIRLPTRPDVPEILRMLEHSGQFDAAGLRWLDAALATQLGTGGDGIWLVADDGKVAGVALCVPEKLASGTWNLLLLWTCADRHRRGHGTQLLHGLVTRLRSQGARLLIVETSGLELFAPARAFYAKCGFRLEASIHHFFAPGDDKLIYTMDLSAGAPQGASAPPP